MSYYSCPCMNIRVLHDDAAYVESSLDECEQVNASLREFSENLATTTTFKSVSGIFAKSNKCFLERRTSPESAASSEWMSAFVKIVIKIKLNN